MKKRDKFYVYILKCSDQTYYTGFTKDLEKRIRQHNETKRGAKYLRSRTPAKLVYVKEYKYYKPAISEEVRIKKLNRRQKEKLINEYNQKNKGAGA